MRLYLDDNLANAALAGQLRKAGHGVVLPIDVGTSGNSDPQHLAYDATNGHVSLTGDHEDFLHLHLLVQATGGRHPGILVVRGDNDPSRDMKPGDIVRAMLNLESIGVPIDELHVLNHWR
jgi:hypothetical protein